MDVTPQRTAAEVLTDFTLGLRQRTINPFDGFVNLLRAGNTDDDGIDVFAGYCIANGFLALGRVLEQAVADKLHADHSVAFFMHEFYLLHHRSDVMSGIIPRRR